MEKSGACGSGGRRGFVMLDVGGTQIKAAVISGEGELVGELRHDPSHAGEGKDEILDHFAAIIRELLEGYGGMTAAGVGMAFPGPFDYERGISLMKGLGKYDQIYGVPIGQEIQGRIPALRDTRFCFLHDVEAFALGESWFGQARGDGKLLCLCIGTGAGSAFIQDRRALKEKGDGVPAHGWLYDTLYKESVIDDYLSVRGLRRLSRKIMGEGLDGKELYERCLRGEEEALRVYREFGGDLKDCLLPFLDDFRPDRVVLGGQISKSISYFGKPLAEACASRGIVLYHEPETSARAMQGLYMMMKQGGIECYVKP